MNIETRLEEALQTAEPSKSLFKLIRSLLESGCERDELETALQSVQEKLLSQRKNEQAELIAEVQDSLTGWCRVD